MSERLIEQLSSGALVLLLIGLSWLAPQSLLAVLATVCVLFYHAHLFGVRALPRAHPLTASLFGILPIIAAQSLVQTCWYYLNGLASSSSDLLCLAIAIVLLNAVFFRRESEPEPSQPTNDEPRTTNFWLAILTTISLIAVAFVLRSAWHVGTQDSIRTPWPLLPPGTLAALAIAGLVPWLAAWKTRRIGAVATFSALAIAGVLFVTPLVYQLGFGFDGFLHRESERLILTTGTLSPKPPYYIGQYVLVTWLARLLDLPIQSIDTALVPTFALLLPFLFALAFRRRKEAPWIIAALPWLMPLEPFIATTPQSFAYLLGLAGLGLGIGTIAGEVSGATAVLVGLWAIAVHPLAGLPFFGAIVLMLWISRCEKIGRNALRSFIPWLLILATVTAIPFAFVLNNARSSTHVSWNFSQLFHAQTYSDAFASLTAPPPTYATLWAGWSVYVLFLLPFVLLALTVVAIWKDEERRAVWICLFALAIGMTISGFVLHTSGQFTFLIDYERGNYADRLYILAQFFLLLPALAGYAFVLRTTIKKPMTGVVTMIFVVLAWQGAHAYTSLPRNDAAIIGHGWSVGRADVEAVHFIEKDADGKPYTVLANQSVSAAAVEAFGFKRYAGDIFYYPIPTGGPLYELFLKAAAHNTSRDLISEAARLGKSSLVYVVLNNYWWDSDRINEELSAIADRSREIQGGKIRIYRFDVRSDKKF